MLVRERMSKNPYTIQAKTPVEQALKQMRAYHFRHLPVLDEANCLVGIVSETDLLYATPSPSTALSLYEMQYVLSKLTIADVMTKDVVTVTEDTPVEDAARIMADRKFGSLPVVRAGQVIGIITETDLFQLFWELLGAREKGVRMTMLVPEKKGALAKIVAEVTLLGGNIVALGMFLGEEPTNRLVALKVADVPQDKLVAALKPLVVEMIDAREL